MSTRHKTTANTPTGQARANWLRRLVRWGCVFAPTELHDENDEPLYVWAKVRPDWYWTLRRWWLFASIVWRQCEPGCRLSAETAWSVACTVHPPNARTQRPRAASGSLE